MWRISPVWYPVIGVASPVIAPVLFLKNRRYKKNLIQADELNRVRLEKAQPLDLPELEYIELTVLVEEKIKKGFSGDAAVSYYFKTDQGDLLFDVGFGAERPALIHNCNNLEVRFDDLDALVISHLHPDHMGGLNASRRKEVMVPGELGLPDGCPCYLPDNAETPGLEPRRIVGPRMLTAGFATTGPLARSLFFMGLTEEQALVARLKGKGLVVFTGCGHPGIELILQMAQRLSSEPVHVVGGGLHFPVTDSRGNRAGVRFQTILGTGKPAWKKITDEDLTQTIYELNRCHPDKVFLSGHDTCDHSLLRLTNELDADTKILTAGSVYRL